MAIIKATAIIVAAGRSERMGSARGNKLLIKIGGTEVLARSMLCYQNAERIEKIFVVASDATARSAREFAEKYRITKLADVLPGGETRAASVLQGLLACKGNELVAIADGARPFTKPEDIDRVVAAAEQYGGAVLCVPSVDTVKQLDPAGLIQETPPRDEIRLAQTPQAFRLDLLLPLMEKAVAEEWPITDDASVFERAGRTVFPVTGDRKNIKITTPDDLSFAEVIAGEKHIPLPRIGHGYDVHRLVEGRPLILCGEQIPFNKGLDGHSDADVALHALMDAMLGAAALGDIGGHFPDTDSAYKGADSGKLLAAVRDILAASGYDLINADLTIVAQAPKLSPYIPLMRQNIAGILGVPVDRISVKATTEEHLGFTGSGEGIAAHAVCMIRQN